MEYTYKIFKYNCTSICFGRFILFKMNLQHQNTGFCRIFKVSSSHLQYIFCLMLYSRNPKHCTEPVGIVFHFCFMFSLNIANMINEPDTKLESFFFLPPPMDVNAKGTLKNVLYSPPSTLGKKCKFLCLSHTTFLAYPKQCVFCADHITNLNFNSINIVPFTIPTPI